MSAVQWAREETIERRFMKCPLTSRQLLEMDNAPDLGQECVEDFALVEVDDHGMSTRRSVFLIDGHHWSVQFSHSSNDGIMDCYDPLHVQPVTKVIIEWKEIPENN
jgi:hypothetical protein